MSVTFCLRRINHLVLAAVREDETLVAALADFMLDFDAAEYEEQWRRAMRGPEEPASRARFSPRSRSSVPGGEWQVWSRRRPGDGCSRPAEVEEIHRALVPVTREEAEPRFRAFESSEREPCTDAEFEEWTWQPFCRLRRLVAEAVASGESLLVWFDV